MPPRPNPHGGLGDVWCICRCTEQPALIPYLSIPPASFTHPSSPSHICIREILSRNPKIFSIQKNYVLPPQEQNLNDIPTPTCFFWPPIIIAPWCCSVHRSLYRAACTHPLRFDPTTLISYLIPRSKLWILILTNILFLLPFFYHVFPWLFYSANRCNSAAVGIIYHSQYSCTLL